MISMKSLIRLFLAFVLVLTGVEYLFFRHTENLLVTQARVATQEIKQIETTSKARARAALIEKLKQNDEGVTISPNGQYLTYVDKAPNGTYAAHVIDLSTGKQISQATNLYPVQNVTWLGNQEIFLGEQIAPGYLEVNTFYISNGAQADQTAAIVPKFSGLAADASIERITYSTQTNDVFVLINTASTSVIYHIGTMENVQLVPYNGGYIKNIAMTQIGDSLYIEESSGSTWDVTCLQQTPNQNPDNPDYSATVAFTIPNAALIGVNGNTLYYGTINTNGLVTAIYELPKGGKRQLVEKLHEPTLASDIAIDSSGKVQLNPTLTSDSTIPPQSGTPS